MSITTHHFIRKLEVQMQRNLPGIDVQKRMAPVPRRIPPLPLTEDDAVPSAVMILLIPTGDGWSFVLTERSTQVEHHQGQVSLPGGAQEEEETLEETALRETEEEIGVDGGSVKLLGCLTPLFIPLSGFLVHPFVGWMDSQPQFNLDSVEVISTPLVSTAELLADGNIKREKWNIRGFEVDVPFFNFSSVTVWGATAMILSEFREILAGIE